MTIERRMTRNPVTARIDMTAVEALTLMKSENVEKAPVLDADGNLVGVITEKEILSVTLHDDKDISLLEMAYRVSNLTLDKLISSDVVTISPDTDIEEVCRIMVTQHISFLPVVDGKKLVGLVSKSDMFKIMMELLGARSYGTRINFRVVDRIGTIADISKCLSEHNISIISLCTYNDEDPSKVICTLKVHGATYEELKELLEPYASGFTDNLGED